jgi:glucokinase
MKGTNAAAVEALDMFVAFYGAEAANLALKVMATGGIYISGGIALNIVEKLKSKTFVDAFLSTGPQNIRQVLAKIPIHIVNFELNGLYGAANFAAHL